MLLKHVKISPSFEELLSTRPLVSLRFSLCFQVKNLLRRREQCSGAVTVVSSRVTWGSASNSESVHFLAQSESTFGCCSVALFDHFKTSENATTAFAPLDSLAYPKRFETVWSEENRAKYHGHHCGHHRRRPAASRPSAPPQLAGKLICVQNAIGESERHSALRSY